MVKPRRHLGGALRFRMFPVSSGIYRTRRVGSTTINYIGQTGAGGITLGRYLTMLGASSGPMLRRPLGRRQFPIPPFRPPLSHGTLPSTKLYATVYETVFNTADTPHSRPALDVEMTRARRCNTEITRIEVFSSARRPQHPATLLENLSFGQTHSRPSIYVAR